MFGSSPGVLALQCCSPRSRGHARRTGLAWLRWGIGASEMELIWTWASACAMLTVHLGAFAGESAGPLSPSHSGSACSGCLCPSLLHCHSSQCQSYCPHTPPGCLGKLAALACFCSQHASVSTCYPSEACQCPCFLAPPDSGPCSLPVDRGLWLAAAASRVEVEGS